MSAYLFNQGQMSDRESLKGSSSFTLNLNELIILCLRDFELRNLKEGNISCLRLCKLSRLSSVANSVTNKIKTLLSKLNTDVDLGYVFLLLFSGTVD